MPLCVTDLGREEWTKWREKKIVIQQSQMGQPFSVKSPSSFIIEGRGLFSSWFLSFFFFNNLSYPRRRKKISFQSSLACLLQLWPNPWILLRTIIFSVSYFFCVTLYSFRGSCRVSVLGDKYGAGETEFAEARKETYLWNYFTQWYKILSIHLSIIDISFPSDTAPAACRI